MPVSNINTSKAEVSNGTCCASARLCVSAVRREILALR